MMYLPAIRATGSLLLKLMSYNLISCVMLSYPRAVYIIGHFEFNLNIVFKINLIEIIPRIKHTATGLCTS